MSQGLVKMKNNYFRHTIRQNVYDEVRISVSYTLWLQIPGQGTGEELDESTSDHQVGRVPEPVDRPDRHQFPTGPDRSKWPPFSHPKLVTILVDWFYQS